MQVYICLREVSFKRAFAVHLQFKVKVDIDSEHTVLKWQVNIPVLKFCLCSNFEKDLFVTTQVLGMKVTPWGLIIRCLLERLELKNRKDLR